MKSINPATGELIAEYPVWTEKQALEQLQLSADAFTGWRETSFSQRKKLMLNLAEGLQKDKAIYARLITEEMGKPISHEGSISSLNWRWTTQDQNENSIRYAVESSIHFSRNIDS